MIGGGDWSKDRIIPDCIRSLESGEKIIVRNPNATRPWQHVLDPLGGYLLLGMKLYSDSSFSGSWNFGPNKESIVPVQKLVKKVISVWGSGEWEHPKLKDEPHEAGLLSLNIEKAIKDLNWQPTFLFDKAVSLTIDWYKKDQPKDVCIEQIKEFLE